MMLLKSCTQYVSKFGKTGNGTQDWKRSVFIPVPKKAMPKNAQTTAQLHSSHMLVKYYSKFSKPGFSNT